MSVFSVALQAYLALLQFGILWEIAVILMPKSMVKDLEFSWAYGHLHFLFLVAGLITLPRIHQESKFNHQVKFICLIDYMTTL